VVRVSGQLEKQDICPRAMMLQPAPLWYNLVQAQRRRNRVEYYETDRLDKIREWSALGVSRERLRPDTSLPELYLTFGGRDTLQILRNKLMFLEALMIVGLGAEVGAHGAEV
jgi:hypothetical protein